MARRVKRDRWYWWDRKVRRLSDHQFQPSALQPEVCIVCGEPKLPTHRGFT